jgi:hypothetical protein
MGTATVVVGTALVAAVATVLAARGAWNARTARLIDGAGPGSGGAAATRPAPDATAVAALPAPVARYLALVLPGGIDGPAPAGPVWLAQRGSFLLDPGRQSWVPFEAEQTVGLDPPWFVWDARMHLGPGVEIRVRDSLVHGRGAMRAALWGLIPLADARGTVAMSEGSLVRYLAEASWFPWALRPSPALRWEPIDADAARATLTVSGVTVALDFHFAASGLVDRVFTPSRPRHVGGRDLPTPWEGRWLAYDRRDGVLIPTRGEVAWLLPEGECVYWRAAVEPDFG